MHCSSVNVYNRPIVIVCTVQMAPEFGGFLTDIQWPSPMVLHLRREEQSIAEAVIELTITLGYVLCYSCDEQFIKYCTHSHLHLPELQHH